MGVSRDTSERRSFEEALTRSEARLRAATELVGLGIYAWDSVTGALDWDERLRRMWGLAPDDPVDMAVYEAGIHPEDLPRVREAIAACVDPAGDGRYAIEYRVIGRDDCINPDTLRTLPAATAFAKAFFDAGKPVASICHGPWTIIEAGAARGRRMTSWPSLKTDLENAGAEWVDREVVVDRGLVTSRKPDDIPAFNREVIALFAEPRA